MSDKKKRGRPKNNIKTNKKVININDLINKSTNNITNLLVHLPFDMTKINLKDDVYENEYLNYDNILNNIEHVPIPFENLEQQTQEEVNYNNKKTILEEVILLKEQKLNKKIYKLENSKIDNILCWWCCHPFDNQVYGIPIKKENDIYITKGFFCSLNCSKSYNLSDNIIFKEKQNRNILINMLNTELNNNGKYVDVKESPQRETLKLFGGHLDINDFRENKKNYKLIYPPIITITPDLEENDLEEENNITINKKQIKNNLLKLFN